jgi:hypothetical protein
LFTIQEWPGHYNKKEEGHPQAFNKQTVMSSSAFFLNDAHLFYVSRIKGNLLQF